MSIAFVDENSEGYIYNPVNSNIIKIPNFSSTNKGIVWETFEPEKVNMI
jgi:WD repeat-containing protein 19